MKFDVITIFPKAFDSYLNESMIKRARAKKIVEINVHDLRDFSEDKHKKVDDRPYGGGPGMVLKIEPIVRAISSIFGIKNSELRIKDKIPLILFSAGGKQFDSKMAAKLSRYEGIGMIAGHYEGVDERIKLLIRNSKFLPLNLSIGPYVLTGGELPAMVVIDAVSRHLPGFLGKAESLEEKRYGVGIPVYTRPEVYEYKGKKYKAPKVLLSGHHHKVGEWKKTHRLGGDSLSKD